MMRALIGTPESRSADAVDLMRQAVALEAAAGGAAHPTAVMSLGNALARDAQFDEAATILLDAWRVRGRASWSASVDLQTAGSLALSLLHLDRVTEFDALLRDAGPLADEVEKAWRDAAAPVVAMLRVVQGRRRYLQARFAEAVPMLARASALAEASGRLSYQVLALSFLADAELAVGERPAAAPRCRGRARSSTTSRWPRSRWASCTRSSASGGPRPGRRRARARSARS